MTDTDRTRYEVVVGGGPAGLTTALYTTRLGHRTAVFEREGGRHAAVNHVHNLLGVSENVSGQELADHALEQVETYGGDIYLDSVDQIERLDGEYSFRLEASHATVDTKRVVLATGFRDHEPDVREIERFAGRGLYYCLHCDAYALGDGSVFVLGHDDDAAHVAMTMLNFTDDVDLLLDGHEPEWDDETAVQLEAHPLERIESEVDSVTSADEGDRFGGLTFADGSFREYLGGFAMYGLTYNTELADALGCELTADGAIAVDDRRESSVDGVYAVGDVTHGQNQTPIAIGDGAYAGLAVHKDLRRFPKPVEAIEPIEAAGSESPASPAEDSSGGSDRDQPETEFSVPGTSPELRARMRRMRGRERYPGLRTPKPNR